MASRVSSDYSCTGECRVVWSESFIINLLILFVFFRRLIVQVLNCGFSNNRFVKNRFYHSVESWPNVDETSNTISLRFLLFTYLTFERFDWWEQRPVEATKGLGTPRPVDRDPFVLLPRLHISSSKVKWCPLYYLFVCLFVLTPSYLTNLFTLTFIIYNSSSPSLFVLMKLSWLFL